MIHFRDSLAAKRAIKRAGSDFLLKIKIGLQPIQSKNKRYRHFLQRFPRLFFLLHRIIDNGIQILIKQFIITDKTMPFHLFLLLNYLFIFLHDLPPASYCLPISVSAGMYLYAQHFPNLHLL
jgi:hypothetical protein